MSERRVRPGSRAIYGRAMPLERPRRRKIAWSGPKLWQRRLFLILVLVGAIGWGIAQLFAISKVTVNAPARKSEVTTQVKKLVAESWRQGDLLTLDSDVLVSKLQQADPLLKTVDVKRKLFHELVVTVTFKQPSLGWSSGNQRYLLDRDGTAIGALPAGVAVPVVVDGSNLPVRVGSKVTSVRFVTFVTALLPAMSAEGVVVTGLDIKDTTLDLTATTDKGYKLIFDTGGAVESEVSDLRAVRTLLASQKRSPAEYIDLRIPGKAYYR